MLEFSIIEKNGKILFCKDNLKGSKTLINYFYSLILILLGIIFFNTGLSLYFSKEIFFKGINDFSYIPQGILLVFYGSFFFF